MTLIVLHIYTFNNVCMGSMLSYYQYENKIKPKSTLWTIK